jgi:hypothetical protein
VPMMQCFNGLLQSNVYQQTDADCRYVEKECLPRLNGFVRGVNIKHRRGELRGEFSTALWIPQPEDSRWVLQVFRVRRFGHSPVLLIVSLAYPMQRMAAFLLRFLLLKCLEVTAASRNAVHSSLASPRSFKFIS